ncbi:ABC transporter permease [Bifidobacterium sp.]|uniref:ABC transporter permease n=1 Tax=Bifidobacterium sp. TaxID=41200 RepID=UPI003D7DFA82
MFVLRNAWKSVTRNKGRNILIIVIVTIIAAAVTIGLSIRQAATTARTNGLADTTVTAQISLDRSKLINESRQQTTTDSDSSDSSETDGKPDFDAMRSALADKQLSLADYQKYAKASSAVKSTYYTETTGLSATDDFQPVSDSDNSSESSGSDNAKKSGDGSDDTDASGKQNGQSTPPDGKMSDSGGMSGQDGETIVSGDFSLVGFSSDEAVSNASNGSFTMVDGKVFGYGASSDGDVIISKSLADFNNLSVGDTITVSDTNDSDTTYKLTIVGIYKNSTDSSQQMGGPMRSTASDPANAIYTSVSTLKSLGLDADADSDSAAQLSYTYVCSSKSDYETFAKDAKKAGLSSDYTVSSADVENYESSLVPLNNLSKFALTLLIVVLAVGAVVLVVITLLNVRERKYEIGVLTAIGVNKVKVAAQFTLELLIVTMIGLAIGAGAGAAVSVPVSNQLLASQIEQQQSQQIGQREQFGRDMTKSGDSTDSKDGSDSSAGSATADESNGDGGKSQRRTQGGPGMMGRAVDYVSSVNATVNLKVVGQLLLVGLGLTLVAALVAVVFVLRYEPLQILADRS